MVEMDEMQVPLEVLKHLLDEADDFDEMDELSFPQLEIHSQ